MAIFAYVGVPGSGKTYEVVKNVILPAFIKGRRIVTNIEGVNEDNFLSYIHELPPKELKKIDLSTLGQIVKVTDEDVLKTNFFPFKNQSVETIAKVGDLICLDEIWRIFDDKKITDEQKSFVAEHRHFVNERGETSDLVVINQSVANIPRFIKDRIQTTFKMTKLSVLGLSSRYRVDVFIGTKLFKTTKSSSYQEKYDSKIFKLYKSYDSDNAGEQNIDERVNLFKRKSFIYVMLFAVLILGISIYSFLNFFSSYHSDEPNKAEQIIEKEKKQVAEKRQETREKERYKPSSNHQYQKDDSSRWRIVGFINTNNKNLVILDDGQHFRYEYLRNFNFNGNFLVGEIDGERVTIYSGKKLPNNYDNKGLF